MKRYRRRVSLAILIVLVCGLTACGNSENMKAASECDVLYIPTDNTIASQADLLKDILISEKVPMIAGEEGLCEAGIATLSISYYDIGYTAGEMAYEILVEGKNTATAL